MSLKKIEQVKADKGFKIWDLILYGAIIMLLVVLFTVIFTTRNTDPLSGVRIYVKGEVIFEYRFGDTPEVLSETVQTEEDANGITVTVSADGDLNVVYIDKSAKTVKMTEANCRGKECMYFPAIDNNSKYIYCNPHGLRVEPYTINLEDPDIIIG